jgi:hypothetical protein
MLALQIVEAEASRLDLPEGALDVTQLGGSRPVLWSRRCQSFDKEAVWIASWCRTTPIGVPSMPSSRTAESSARCRLTSLQRADHGEQPYWALLLLVASLGQIGLPGGGFGFGYEPAAALAEPPRSFPGPAMPVVPNPARSSTTSGCRPYWSRSRRSRPPTRRVSSAGTWRGSDRQTTSRRQICRRRGGRHATVLPWFRPDLAASLVFRYVTKLPPAKPATIARWPSGFLRDREIYSEATAAGREPAGSDRLPVPSA